MPVNLNYQSINCGNKIEQGKINKAVGPFTPIFCTVCAKRLKWEDYRNDERTGKIEKAEREKEEKCIL